MKTLLYVTGVRGLVLITGQEPVLLSTGFDNERIFEI